MSIKVDNNKNIEEEEFDLNRIQAMEIRIRNLKNRVNYLKNAAMYEEFDTSRYNRHLNNLSRTNENIVKNDGKINSEIDAEIKNLKDNLLLTMNVDNISKQNIIGSKDKEIERQKQEIAELRQMVILEKTENNKVKMINDELMNINSQKNNEINKANEKAYGLNLTNKYEANRLKNNQIDPRINENNSNLWDRENVGYQGNNNFDEFAKEKQLWLNNASNTQKNIGTGNSGNTGNTGQILNNSKNNEGNMKKYSKMIINSK